MAITEIRSEYFDTLNVDDNAGTPLIETNARKLLARFGPDAEKGNERAQQRRDDVIEAFAVLTHPKLRSAYNTQGFAGVDAMANTLATAKQAAIERLQKAKPVDVEPLVFQVIETARQPSAPLPEGVTPFIYRDANEPR